MQNDPDSERDWTPYIILGFIMTCFFAGLVILSLSVAFD